MPFPELTDAELAESRKLLLRFARIQLPDRPDLAEEPCAGNHAFRLPRCRRFQRRCTSGQLVVCHSEKQNLPTACARLDGSAKYSPRLRKKCWTKPLKNGLHQMGIGRRKAIRKLGPRPKKRWTTKSFVKSCKPASTKCRKTPPACLP